tara:strand:- start:1238 stop:1843 length:606 start_codon:yes stop_codon:yes gene_type:complete
MKIKNLKDKLTREVFKNFNNLNFKDLSNLVDFKKLGIKELECKKYLASFFPKGINDVFIHFNEMISIELRDQTKEKLKKFSVSEKIKFLLLKRLELLEKENINYKHTLRYLIQPKNLLFTNNLLFKVCDEIWFLAGDKSLDFNYYSKRIILMNIYSTGLIYWIFDKSLNKFKSIEFIEKQITNVSKIGKLKYLLKNMFKKN